jgi:NADH dehydrogenase (ubiquinone) 1 alpha subcomplex subunit 9
VENIRHSDIVYNLIGRNFETKNFSFDQVHHEAPRRLARLAKECGVQKFVHVSALGADVNSTSAFLRSKALGEIAVREEFPDATIVRPSWVYGYEDRFWNKMGWFVKWAPFSMVMAPNGGNATMRPVFVNDVAAALATMTKEDQTVGQVVELYGPRTYTYAKLIELFQDASMRQHRTLPLPKQLLKPFCKLWSSVLAFPIMSADEVERVLDIHVVDYF